MVLYRLHAQQDVADVQICKAVISQMEECFDMYYLRKKGYPSSKEGFEKLVNEKIIKEIPKDSWGEPLNYAYPSEHNIKYDIWSNGKDMASGGGDDITNWDE